MPDSPRITTTAGPDHWEIGDDLYQRLDDRLRHAEQFLAETTKALREAREILEEDEA